MYSWMKSGSYICVTFAINLACLCEVQTLIDKRHSDYFEQNSKLLIQWWNSSVLSNLYKLKMRWNVQNIPDIANVPSILFKGSDKFHNYLAGNHVWVLWNNPFCVCQRLLDCSVQNFQNSNCCSSLLLVHLIVLTAQYTSALATCLLFNCVMA